MVKNHYNIMIISSVGRSLTHFRGDMISHLIKNGHRVYCLAPRMEADTLESLREIGVKPFSYDLSRTGLNPFSDLRTYFQIKKVLSENEIDLVFPYTIKPVIYGSLAANSNNIPVISLITGLGFTFSGTSAKSGLFQKLIEILYRFSIRKNRLVIFQNKDDRDLFVQKRILRKGQETKVVDGSGVNLNKYPFRELRVKSDNEIKFVVVARLIREKGIQLFMDAAINLRRQFPKSEYHIIGAPDKSPSAISIDELKKYHKEGLIHYHGRQNEISKLLQDMHVFVLPTFYREGIPRSILEALSIGMPIITTDTPGCRETVVEGKNGLLIRPNSLNDLKSAMEFFIRNPDKVYEMGKLSGALARSRFDVNIINQKLINYIEEYTGW